MKPWYENGIRFTCTKCTGCCSGAPGMVWVSLEEIANISEFLGITTTEFGKKYLRLVDRRLSLTERANYDCVFLSKEGCSIYPVRPLQCRTFPFWKEIMIDRETWERVTKFCPGVNQGKLYSQNEIEKIMNGDIDAAKADCD